jgi:hypothetical protein
LGQEARLRDGLVALVAAPVTAVIDSRERDVNLIDLQAKQ